MKLSQLFFPPPVRARHVKRTYVSSPDDEASQATPEVIRMALDVVRRTLEVDVSAVSARMKAEPRWPDTWPGEHYRLLAGFGLQRSAQQSHLTAGIAQQVARLLIHARDADGGAAGNADRFRAEYHLREGKRIHAQVQ